jgi:hypothetical protein
MLAVIKHPMRHYTMMKLRIAPGLGLVLFMATMIGDPVSQAQARERRVTMARLAGKFAVAGSGSFTLCLSAGALGSCSSGSPVALVTMNDRLVAQLTRDAAGNGCGVATDTIVPVSGTSLPAMVTKTHSVSTITSFDPTTGTGTISRSRYLGGSCVGATFHNAGAHLLDTNTGTFVVSDSGNRIEEVFTGSLTQSFVAGMVFSFTDIRQ